MTVYVYYPRGLATGGPEALHQLVDSLRRQNQPAFLVPIPGTESAPRAERYDQYDAPEASAAGDTPGDIVVVPETQALLLKPLRKARGYVWWLSIDYAPRFVIERDATSLLPIERTRNTRFPLLQVRAAKRALRGLVTGEDRVLRGSGHLAQSHYAWNHVFAHIGRVGVDSERLHTGRPARCRDDRGAHPSRRVQPGEVAAHHGRVRSALARHRAAAAREHDGRGGRRGACDLARLPRSRSAPGQRPHAARGCGHGLRRARREPRRRGERRRRADPARPQDRCRPRHRAQREARARSGVRGSHRRARGAGRVPRSDPPRARRLRR